MKKFYYYMMIVVTLTTACNKNDPEIDPEIDQITMTTKLSYVSIVLNGYGTATIDWGDNSQVDTYNLKGVNSSIDVSIACTHVYSNSTNHNITITGENITYLDCVDQGILQLDISRNPKLIRLQSGINELSSLDVSHNVDLISLDVHMNQLEHLDVSKNTKLNFLDCQSNNLTELDVKNNVVLTYLRCQNNQLTTEALNSLFESLNNTIQGNTKALLITDNPGSMYCDRSIAERKEWSIMDCYIITMTVEYQQVTFTMIGAGPVQIDWGDNSEIEIDTLYNLNGWFFYNHEYADASPHTVIINGENISWFSNINTGCTMFDVSRNPKLAILSCADNRLTSLDVSKNPSLMTLYCDNNELSELDVSKNYSLSIFSCYGNTLTELDLHNNPALYRFICYNNKLSTLDVSRNELLRVFYCYDNNLTELDLSHNTILSELICENNKLTSSAINAMFDTLHNNLTPTGTKVVYLGTNPGVDNCDTSIAISKGWIIFKDPYFASDTSSSE